MTIHQQLVNSEKEIEGSPRKFSVQRDYALDAHEKNESAVVEVTVISHQTEFLSLRSEWNDLVDSAPVNVFQTFDWQWFWWKHYGEGLQLHILTFRDQGTLVGIAPLFLQTTTLFGKTLHRVLRLIGSGVGSKENYGLPAEYGVSDYLDFIICPEYETTVAVAFTHYLLKHHGSCDEVALENLPHDNVVSKHFLSIVETEGLQTSVVQTEHAPYIITPPSTEEFINHLKPGVRYRLRQSKKQFKQNPPFSIESINSQTLLQRSFSDLVHFHQLRWNSLGYAGLFSDRRFLEFQRDVIQKFYEQGILWFKTVRMGGIHTAARLGFMFKGIFYDYLSGFDEALPGGKRRPSLALLMEMIEDAVTYKCSKVDLLRGTEQYKLELTSTTFQNSTIRIHGLTKRSVMIRVMYFVDKLRRAFMRKIADEKKLLAIQIKIHGPAKCLFTYSVFAAKRLRQKFVH